MSASTHFDDVPIPRSRSARGHSGNFPARSSSRQQSQNEASPQMPRTTSRAPDDANASTHTLVNPPERAPKAQHDDTIDTQQARGNIKSLHRQIQRLEPAARGGSSTRTRWAEDHHERKSQSEQHESAHDHGERTQKTGAMRKRIYIYIYIYIYIAATTSSLTS